jgi:hypothetical protein
MAEPCDPSVQSCPPKTPAEPNNTTTEKDPNSKQKKASSSSSKKTAAAPSTGGEAVVAGQRLTNQQLMGPVANPLDPNALASQQQKSSGPKLTFEQACERPELFNYLDTNNFGESYNEKKTTAVGALRGLIQERYIPDTLGSSGPYRAIVIQIVDDGTGLAAGGEVGEPGSAEFLLNKYTDLKIEPRVRVRCRVPGIDTLPIPEGALGGKLTPYQQDIVEMHAVYTANQKYPVPKLGDLVYVDWRYKPKDGPWKDPLYLGRVNEQVGISAQSLMNALQEFQKLCGGGFGAMGGLAGGSLGPTGGAPVTIPKDIKFSPTGVIVPPERWADEKARYLYYLYDKQISAKQGNLQELKNYWRAGGTMMMKGMPAAEPWFGTAAEAKHTYKGFLRMAYLVIWCCETSGLGAERGAPVLWGMMKAEGRWNPTGCFLNNPEKAIARSYDSGFGIGQYVDYRYKRMMKRAPAKNDSTCGNGKLWIHSDCLDPFIALYSVCLDYRRLFNKFGGNPPIEALGAWWACPGRLKQAKQGAVAFKAACPKGDRKKRHIAWYGEYIKPLLANKAQIMIEAKKLIDARPIPVFPSYEEWVQGKLGIQAASKDSNVPTQFLGKTKDNKNFDTRTMKTVPGGAAVKKGTENGKTVYQVVGTANYEDGRALLSPPTQSPVPPTTSKEQPKAEHKPLKNVAPVVGAAAAPCPPASTAANNAGKKKKQVILKTVDGKKFDKNTMKTIPEGAPVGKKEPKGSGFPDEYEVIGSAPDPDANKVMSGGEETQTSVKNKKAKKAPCGSAAAPAIITQPMAMGGLCSMAGGGMGAGGMPGAGVMGGGVPSLGQPAVLTGGARPSPAQVRQAHLQILQKRSGGYPPDGNLPRGAGDGKGWKGKCLQFSAKMANMCGSPRVKTKTNKYKCSTQIQSFLPIVKTADGKYFGAGLTLKELMALNPPAGLCVHVKLCWNVERCYHLTDNGHHWYFTDGANGLWDSHHTPGKPMMGGGGPTGERWMKSRGAKILKKAEAGDAKWAKSLACWNAGPRRGRRLYVHACYDAFA